MTDIHIELVVNESESKQLSDSKDGIVSDVKIDLSKDQSATQKRQKYDGRSKKRNWEFNRRDDNVKKIKTNPEDRVKRRKCLMILGYAGANYIGMQRNPDVNTIEEELLKALFKNNMITEQAFNKPQYAHFQRAARTDKGVSAARQCISMKLRKKHLYNQLYTYLFFFIFFFLHFQRRKLI